jgi:hypothetical protein
MNSLGRRLRPEAVHFQSRLVARVCLSAKLDPVGSATSASSVFPKERCQTLEVC